ncbi:MAG TPA: DUF6351 family protein, partial [Gaiellaceae bacterium]|nr:DUF6351 family protein [Gaiellaceae bacterium]
NDKLELSVVSSPAQYVSGGDARIEIAVPDGTALSAVKVTLNGANVTSAFGPDPEGNHQLEGVVTGLPLGESTVAANMPGPGKSQRSAELTLTNNPLQGPIFSGPHQTPFLCASTGNSAGMGLPPIPQSPTCETPTIVSFVYRNLAGQFLDYDPASPPPAASIEMTTTIDGKTVPMILRWERGVINRFMYSILMLSPGSQTATPDLSAWNRKALFSFSGGVAIGHYQGAASGGDMRHLAGLRMGYAVLYSSGTRTNTHYNLQLGGETAIMVKDRFVSAYAEPEYTIGVGGSGGAIQQYVYGQNHPGLLDGGVPQYSYSDMVTQTIHVGDCELLERWLDSKVLADPFSMWRTWVNRTLVEGLSTSAIFSNPYSVLMPYMPTPGSSECINGWRGLSPLALNPHFGTAPGYNPAVHGPVEWTHWGDLVNIYGTDESGFARSPWDNVGVQYGLAALKSGAITPAQFLDLNANVGSWKASKDMVQEGCPFIAALCASQPPDIWSARNMTLSPDGGVTPAARREGNREAGYAAYRSGMVFRGKLDIPVIDWRHYLEHRLDMHNSHQSFASRQRLLNYDGDASNQLIWFTDARPGTPQSDATPQAFLVLDRWIKNIQANPDKSVGENKPADAKDACFATNGALIASGDDVWDGILDGDPAGVCTQAFPLYSTSRIVAGGPIEGGIFKCALQPVERALAHGLYGAWQPSDAELAQLHGIFPQGVCDYTKPDLALPPELSGSSQGAKK